MNEAICVESCCHREATRASATAYLMSGRQVSRQVNGLRSGILGPSTCAVMIA